MRVHYEPLTALDAMFLDLEDPTDPLHIAVALVFDARALTGPNGRLDVIRIRQHLAATVAGLPRLHQRVLRVPWLGRRVWVDDAGFDLDRHVHHERLQPAASNARLREWLGRWHAQPLVRDRPLWDLCVVEGIARHRFVVALKVHHAVLDGLAGIAALTALLRTDPQPGPTPVQPWSPRPTPSLIAVVGEELRRRADTALATARDAILRPAHSLIELRNTIIGLASTARNVIVPAPVTSLNPNHTGPRRAYAWADFDLAQVKAIRHTARVTVNDVVLATVASAIQRFLGQRGERISRRGLRVAVPASAHAANADVLGNEVSMMFASLPWCTSGPLEHLTRVATAMRRTKASLQTFAIAEGEWLADWVSPGALATVARIAIRMRPYNLIVTNVPGPQMPLYLLDARLLEALPLVPLYGNQAIGIAVLSYAGRIAFGINADADRVPDVDVLARALEESFQELCAACVPGTAVRKRRTRDASAHGDRHMGTVPGPAR